MPAATGAVASALACAGLAGAACWLAAAAALPLRSFAGTAGPGLRNAMPKMALPGAAPSAGELVPLLFAEWTEAEEVNPRATSGFAGTILATGARLGLAARAAEGLAAMSAGDDGARDNTGTRAVGMGVFEPLPAALAGPADDAPAAPWLAMPVDAALPFWAACSAGVSEDRDRCLPLRVPHW